MASGSRWRRPADRIRNRRWTRQLSRHEQHAREHYAELVARRPPVVIYQMGKVASSTLHRALVESYDGLVVHAHRFGPYAPDPVARRLFQDFRAGLPLRIISLTRQPIERNISDFFENFTRYTGRDVLDEEWSVPRLRQAFLAQVPQEYPATWFDDRFRPSVRVDVYDHRVSSDGVLRAAADGNEVLVLRAEAPDEVKLRAVSELTHVTGLQLRPVNVGTTKRYADTYRRFVAQVRFPEEVVAGAVESRYFRHFYAGDWGRRARERWSESIGRPEAPGPNG